LGAKPDASQFIPAGVAVVRDIHKIIIHTADVPNGRETHASDIDLWHKERGWSGIGYHYVITLDGMVEQGRPIEKVGAHVKGHNKNSIGICLIGDDKFTRPQWDCLHQLLADLGLQYPASTVHGHHEFNADKTCPNFNVSQWLTEPVRIQQQHLWEG